MASWIGIVPDQLRPALAALLRAANYADECHVDRWQFAIDASEIAALGATLTDIRWLIRRGYVLHAKETTVPGDAERAFRPLPVTAIPADAHLVLSVAGAKEIEVGLRGLSAHLDKHIVQTTDEPAATSPPPDLKPEWDSDRRELRYQGQIIKRFRVPAENQELILTAFQEEGWPQCIDDPLPPDGEVDPKQRLQATIKSLNRNQLVKKLIRFHGNGSGLRIYWEIIATQGRASHGKRGRFANSHHEALP